MPTKRGQYKRELRIQHKNVSAAWRRKWKTSQIIDKITRKIRRTSTLNNGHKTGPIIKSFKVVNISTATKLQINGMNDCILYDLSLSLSLHRYTAWTHTPSQRETNLVQSSSQNAHKKHINFSLIITSSVRAKWC